MKLRKDKRFTLEEISAHGWEIIIDTSLFPDVFFKKGHKDLQTTYDGNKFYIVRIIDYSSEYAT